MRHHHPIQSRLQIARAKSGVTANLVHTLAGVGVAHPRFALEAEEPGGRVSSHVAPFGH
jgi:hypothetical protein